MVRKSPHQVDVYVDRLAAVTDWLGIRVEPYPAWTVAALEREIALIGRLAQPFRNRGDEKAAALLKQIDARSAHLQTLIEQWSNVSTWPHHAAKRLASTPAPPGLTGRRAGTEKRAPR